MKSTFHAMCLRIFNRERNVPSAFTPEISYKGSYNSQEDEKQTTTLYRVRMCSRQATVTVQQAYTERRASHENTERVTNSLMNAIAVQAATNRCGCKIKVRA